MKKNGFVFFREGQGLKSLLLVVIMTTTANFVTAQDFSGLSLAGGKFGEINLKFGYQFEGLTRDNVTEWFNYDIHNFYQTDPGFYFGAEYLYPLFDQRLKLGLGLQYELPKEAWDGYSGDPADLENERVKYSLLPVYATIQYHPIKNLQGLFVKGNIGYSFLTSIELLPDGIPRPDLDEKKGGLYWQISAGFEADWGLILECFYSQKYFSAKWDFSDLGMPATSNDLYKAKDVGVSIGYKIKL
jgi:hypothetical protein